MIFEIIQRAREASPRKIPLRSQQWHPHGISMPDGRLARELVRRSPITTRVDIEPSSRGKGEARRAGQPAGPKNPRAGSQSEIRAVRVLVQGIPNMATNAAPIAATWITIAQAADLMSVSTKTVRRLISRGQLPARRIGSRMIRIDAADLDALGRNLTVAHV